MANDNYKFVLSIGAKGQVDREEDRWFKPIPRIVVGMLAHCPASSKYVPGVNTGGVKAVTKGTGHPTLLWLRISVPSNGHSPNLRNHTDSPLTLLSINAEIHVFILNVS